MKWLRWVAILALAVLWLPITMHCQLEHLPGFAFLACCNHTDKVPHEDNDCDEDGCAVVESGLYMAANNPLLVNSPEFAPFTGFLYALTPAPTLPPLLVSACSTGPPPLANTWQFSTRAASSPRAPSIFS